MSVSQFTVYPLDHLSFHVIVQSELQPIGLDGHVAQSDVCMCCIMCLLLYSVCSMSVLMQATKDVYLQQK